MLACKGILPFEVCILYFLHFVTLHLQALVYLKNNKTNHKWPLLAVLGQRERRGEDNH